MMSKFSLIEFLTNVLKTSVGFSAFLLSDTCNALTQQKWYLYLGLR